MKVSKTTLGYCVGLTALIGSSVLAWADAKSNPYRPIIERNAFGLHDPPPPVVETAPPPPPPPAAQVKLTGIHNLLSSKKALLEITEPGAGKTPQKPILGEGERLDSVEVLEINVEKNEVKIRNGTIVTNLTFEVASSGPTPGAVPTPPVAGHPGAPGVRSFPARPGFTPSVPVPPPSIPTPTTTSSGGRGGNRTSVVLSGANSIEAPATTHSFNANGAAVTTFSGASSSTPIGAGGLQAIPSRPIRTQPTPNNPNQKPLTREEAILMIEAQRLAHPNLPLPPTPLTPSMQADQQQ